MSHKYIEFKSLHPITEDILLALFAIFIPAGPVFFRTHWSRSFVICFFLSVFLLYLPGVVYSWYIIYTTSSYFGSFVYSDLENQSETVLLGDDSFVVDDSLCLVDLSRTTENESVVPPPSYDAPYNDNVDNKVQK